MGFFIKLKRFVIPVKTGIHWFLMFFPCLLGGFLLAASSHADGPRMSAVVDKTSLTMNDNLTLTLTFSGQRVDVQRPNLPPVPGFRVTFSGQSQNYSFINGAISSEVAYTYILEPQAPGSYTIPAFSVPSGGETLSSDPISVQVLSASSRPSIPKETSRSDPVVEGAKNIFVETVVDKRTPWVGESMVLRFRLYNRLPLAGAPQYQPADTTGFLNEDIPPQKNYQAGRDGLNYQVTELTTALFPTAAGRYTIGSASLQVGVPQRSRSSDPFASFFDDMMTQVRPLTLRSDPISVTVRPLPDAGRPGGFRGDVGRYKITAKLDRAQASVHEPVTLTVTLSGEGNIKALSNPGLPVLSDFKVYETLTSLNISKEGDRLRGSKVFTTVLKPQASGDLKIPPFVFSFFNPETATYQTVQTSPLSLRVLPSDKASPVLEGPTAFEDVQVLGQDIRFIKTPDRLRSAPSRLSPWTLGLWFHGVPPLVFFFIWTATGFRRRVALDKTGRRFRTAFARADRGARKPLPKNDGELPQAVEVLHRVWLDYLGAKMAVPPQGLTWEQVKDRLVRLSVDEPTQQDAEKLWNDFDQARFTASLLTLDTAQQLVDRLRDLLRRLDPLWRKPC